MFWPSSPFLAAMLALIFSISSTVYAEDAKPVTAYVSGAVKPQSGFRFSGKARISDLLKQVSYNESACPGSAALLRNSLKSKQEKWKAGILYDIQALQFKARLSGQATLLAWLQSLEKLVVSLPVTGRLPAIYINPHGNESRPADNLLLEPFDRLYVPACSRKLSLVDGKLIRVAYRADLTLNKLAEQLPDHRWQQSGYVWVVHPDGAFRRVKAGYWQHLELYPGDGAFIFRPLKKELLAGLNPGFNFELARWLSTQVVAGE